METIKVTVNGITLFRKQDEKGVFFNVKLQIKEKIDGYKEDKDGNRILTKVSELSIERPQFTKEVCAANDDIRSYRNGRETGFDQKALAVLFVDSTLEIIRTHHNKDEEKLDDDGNPLKNDKGEIDTYLRDCYTTNVTGITLSKRAQDLLKDWFKNAL